MGDNHWYDGGKRIRQNNDRTCCYLLDNRAIAFAYVVPLFCLAYDNVAALLFAALCAFAAAGDA